MNGTETAKFDLQNSTSERIEIFYQLAFFLIGTPINVVALISSSRLSRNVREGGVESRLVTLSRQLLIAHIMVLFVYGVWRSYWIYTIVWVQGDVMCRIFSFLCALPFHLWSNMVAAIAVDMLCCITSPLSSYRTGASRVNWLISIAWGCAIVCAMPMIFVKEKIRIQTPDPSEELYQCYPDQTKYSRDFLIVFSMFHVLTTFYIPLFVVVICYLLIGLSLRRQMAERRLLQDGGQNHKHSNTKARFLRASIAIICTFFFTWLPYQILALLRVICEEECQNIVGKLNWLQAIIIASTCINPFLYRFGTEPQKRNSHFCSTMDTAGKEEVALSGDRRRYVKSKINDSMVEIQDAVKLRLARNQHQHQQPLDMVAQQRYESRSVSQIDLKIQKVMKCKRSGSAGANPGV